ncbi:MAG: tetratricopeptide repeat protein, partial [Pyrinomonadaceae bacterium]|nr:tetratricopeptide repeat protein [Pyrinomonadaceae bacterium]
MKLLYLFSLFILLAGLVVQPAQAQGGGHILYGDVKVDESKVTGIKPISYDLILYLGSQIVRRQTVSSEGRYRFVDLSNGYYDLVVELENHEIARIRVEITSPRINTDYRQDITLEWKAPFNAPAKAASISAADYYQRSSSNQKLFEKAQTATDKKKYTEASALLQQLLKEDPGDFQAWTEFGTLNLLQQNLPEAEKAYAQAIEVRPKFFLALLNLGKLRAAQKKYAEAVEPLTLALELQPTSASLNFLLGETYLQLKKGSKAVVYLYEAIKLDPTGMTEAHLRLASLYHAAGLKDKAAIEFEEFLKKKPDYP